MVNDINSVEDILNYIKNDSENLWDAKSSCLVGLSLFGTNNCLPIQRYIISIKERDSSLKSLELFLDLYNNTYYREFIYYTFLKYLENEIDSIEYFKFIKVKFKSEFLEIFLKPQLREQQSKQHININSKSNYILNQILDQLYSNLNHLSTYIKECENLYNYFNPISYLIQNQHDDKLFSVLLNLIEFVCGYLNDQKYYQYSVLLYLLFKAKFSNSICKILKDNQQHQPPPSPSSSSKVSSPPLSHKDEKESEEMDIENSKISTNSSSSGNNKNNSNSNNNNNNNSDISNENQPNETLIKKIKQFWFKGLNNLKLYWNKYQFIDKEFKLDSYSGGDNSDNQENKMDEDDNSSNNNNNNSSNSNNININLYNELFLKGINEYCLPIIFYINNEEFEELNKLEVISYCWRYYICKRDDITDSHVKEIQEFLQQFADSGIILKKQPISEIITNFKINLVDPEKTRNEYFERNSEDETQSNESYDFEIHLGIYLLCSIFYISCWRYFKFLTTGSSRIEKQYTITHSETDSDIIIDSTLDDISISAANNDNNNNDSSSSSSRSSSGGISSGISNNKTKLSMIVHQLLIYSNIEDENTFDDQLSNINFTDQQKEAIKHLQLCVECYNDLNQDSWIESFKLIFSTIWNHPKFYWLYNSFAESSFFYESYSMSLNHYRDTKTLLSHFYSKTLIPLGSGYKKLFDPKNELWLNRLALNIAVTNHSEIEDSIIGLLEILISISIPDKLIVSNHTFKTTKPYFTDYTEDDILFWCIDALATCYERLGMVGEMTVLYQLYWDYYKPRFLQMMDEIKGTPSKNDIPLSNLVKKDLQIGYFFPRFFDYIVNIEMLEEFCYVLNKGFKLDILPRGQQITHNGNKEMIEIITRHITRTSSSNSYALPNLLKIFFAEELQHFQSKSKK